MACARGVGRERFFKGWVACTLKMIYPPDCTRPGFTGLHLLRSTLPSAILPVLPHLHFTTSTCLPTTLKFGPNLAILSKIPCRTMVVRLGPRGNQKIKIFQVRFFHFLRRDLCRACPEVSETGLRSKIGQRQPENECNALWTPSANPAVSKIIFKHDFYFLNEFTTI